MSDPGAPPAEPAQPPETVTAWHPMLLELLTVFLPSGWRLLAEFYLMRLPQRIDVVILEQVGEERGEVRKLHSIFDYLRPHNLIEYKGPTDDLCAEDVAVILAYGVQYMRLKKLTEPRDICLMVVADRIPEAFVERVVKHDGRFEHRTAQLKGDDWLYVVFDCATKPKLHIVQDPARLGWQPVVQVARYEVGPEKILQSADAAR